MAQPNGDVIVIRSHFPGFLVDYDISDMVVNHVVEFTGLGLPPVEHIMQSGPQQDGASYFGFRLQPRIVTMSIASINATPERFHQRRINLLKMFAPFESSLLGSQAAPPLYPAATLIRGAHLQLRWTFTRQPSSGGPVTETRVLYCVVNNGLQLPSARMVKHSFRDTVQLLAANPLWWDETPVTANQGSFGTGTINATFNIDRSADDNGWDTYPILTVTGPATGITLTNETLGLAINRSGTLAAGTTNILDLRYGIKTVKDGGGSAALAVWAGDLGTFKLGRGVNAMRFQCTGATGATALSWQYYRSFIGI